MKYCHMVLVSAHTITIQVNQLTWVNTFVSAFGFLTSPTVIRQSILTYYSIISAHVWLLYFNSWSQKELQSLCTRFSVTTCTVRWLVWLYWLAVIAKIHSWTFVKLGLKIPIWWKFGSYLWPVIHLKLFDQIHYSGKILHLAWMFHIHNEEAGNHSFSWIWTVIYSFICV